MNITKHLFAKKNKPSEARSIFEADKGLEAVLREMSHDVQADIHSANCDLYQELAAVWNDVRVTSATFDSQRGQLTLSAEGRTVHIATSSTEAAQVAAMAGLETVWVRVLLLKGAPVLYFSSVSWSFAVRADNVLMA